MKQLISIITRQILDQIQENEINMVRLENFDNPIIYKNICEKLLSSKKFSCFIAKLTLEKYRQFVSENCKNWEQAITFLHKGSNGEYVVQPTETYVTNSYVDFNHAITKWRNESPNLSSNATSLILLMGTEAAPDDAGSLMDTTFVISPKEIIWRLNADYSDWFDGVLLNNSIDSPDSRKALQTLYRTLFSNINIDIFKLSNFIDTLQQMQFSSCQDLVDYICETLNTVWGVPSIVDSKFVPKINTLSKGKLSSAKIITDAIKFIDRSDDIPTAAAEKRLKKKFEKYAEDNQIDERLPFPTETAVFSSYIEFENCILDFKRGINLDINRSRLLRMDYAIINSIIGVKLKVEATPDKAVTVVGHPMEAFSTMFLAAADGFRVEFNSFPSNFCVRLDKISLSDCIDTQKEDAFRNVCAFLGGILDFYNTSNIENEGSLIEFEFEDNLDPFDFDNHQLFIDRVKSTGKWGEPSKICMTVTASDDEHKHKYEFKWAFSPYAPWANAFSFLSSVLFRNNNDSYTLPSMVVCKNIQDYLYCESEDEFYSQLDNLNDEVLGDEYCGEIHKYFSGNIVEAMFNKLCNDFREYSVRLIDHGFYNALNLLRKVVQSYTELMRQIHDDYKKFTDVQLEKLPLLLNCFVITSNPDVIESCDVKEVILPSYNPVMLEKIDAQQLFIRDGFAELMASSIAGTAAQGKIKGKLNSLLRLSSITQGADFLYRKPGINLICKNMWEYFGVYYAADISEDLISGNSFGNSIVTDDEDASAMLHVTPISNIVVRNVLDYMHTFPARVDGIEVAFVAPVDMQHIVAAIHTIAKHLEHDEIRATINLRIICINSKKNSSSYLRKWLDSYFDEVRTVKVNTYLRNVVISSKADVEILKDQLKDTDICFNYNILQAADLQFDLSGNTLIDKEQAKFPMTFTPDTIPATSGKARKINLSQFQFLAAKQQAQANYVVSHPNSIPGTYRTFQTMELVDTQNAIIELSHVACKWVVCIDSAIDRKMLETAGSKIIGFTTGEGNYGELNVTVSARSDILVDIKRFLQKRIKEKFPDWDETRLYKATVYCVDTLSQFMDGSRILKALNPYDYEIHSFLAYILTIQMLGLNDVDDKYAVRALISLDSYKHWFAEDEELCKDNKRPDFMLIEIPRDQENLDPEKKLKIKVKIIECKMGFENENHLIKAQTQLEKGLYTMGMNWDPNNNTIMHRYWLNQLYRAIIFSPLYLENTSEEYSIIRDKIYNILSGKYEIEWSGDIFAFWLDSNAAAPCEQEISSTLFDDLAEQGITLESMICHTCGQVFIQKMLLPPEERNTSFILNSGLVPTDEEDVIPDDDDVEENVEISDEGTSAEEIPTGESIPRVATVYLPYIKFLVLQQECTRKISLEWFTSHFSITENDKKLVYESNGHPKWETVLDTVITDFRHNKLLENSERASFHLTELGRQFATEAEELMSNDSFELALRSYENRKSHADSGEDKADGTDSHFATHMNNSIDRTEATGTSSETAETSSSACEAPTKPTLSDVRFLIGQDIRTKEKFFWEFGNKNLNNRHLLINGNSGCGKTYCIQTLLLEMVCAGVSGVVFDYTSGFTPDKLDPAFIAALGDKIQQRVVYINKIPVNPFAKQTVKVGGIEVPEADTFVATRLANVFTTVYGFGGQQKSALYKAIKNGLQHHKDKMSFSYLEEELNDVSAKQAETVLSKIQPFLDLEPFAEDEEFSWSSIRDSGGMVYVMQLDGFDRPTQLLLTELLLWDIWNYCVKNGNEEHPFVVVLDEAQNLNHDAESPSAKFLTEGRKFGVSAWYATQFMKPQLTDDEIQRLQQAGQKLYFCPPDDGVMTVAKNIDIDTQGAKEWAPRLKALKKGECVTCGNMARNGKWTKYEPKIIKVTSLQERIGHD